MWFFSQWLGKGYLRGVDAGGKKSQLSLLDVLSNWNFSFFGLVKKMKCIWNMFGFSRKYEILKLLT